MVCHMPHSLHAFQRLSKTVAGGKFVGYVFGAKDHVLPFLTLCATRLDLTIGVKTSTNNNQDPVSGHLHLRVAQL